VLAARWSETLLESLGWEIRVSFNPSLMEVFSA